MTVEQRQTIGGVENGKGLKPCRTGADQAIFLSQRGV